MVCVCERGLICIVLTTEELCSTELCLKYLTLSTVDVIMNECLYYQPNASL